MRTETNSDAKAIEVQRLVRVPWSADEDEDIRLTYAYANGAFPSYRSQASDLSGAKCATNGTRRA